MGPPREFRRAGFGGIRGSSVASVPHGLFPLSYPSREGHVHSHRAVGWSQDGAGGEATGFEGKGWRTQRGDGGCLERLEGKDA